MHRGVVLVAVLERDKEVKRCTLLELVEYINSAHGQQVRERERAASRLGNVRPSNGQKPRSHGITLSMKDPAGK